MGVMATDEAVDGTHPHPETAGTAAPCLEEVVDGHLVGAVPAQRPEGEVCEVVYLADWGDLGTVLAGVSIG